IPGNDDAIRSVGLLTRIIADAAAEGLIQRHQKPEAGAEEVEPLAAWEAERLQASETVEAETTPAQSSAETAKVADIAVAAAEADFVEDEVAAVAADAADETK
ncbi:MAG: 30S ribosomal protein S2, partial [Leifsonia sp.]